MSCRAGREEPLGRLGANDAYTRHFRLTSGEAFGTHRSQSSSGDLSVDSTAFRRTSKIKGRVLWAARGENSASLWPNGRYT